MNKKLSTKDFVTLGLLCAVLLLMAYTPLGYLNIGPLAITFNMIPVAIAAIAVGPLGGAVAGAVFGLTSFLQCIGVGGLSAFGAALFAINPFLTFLMCMLPRLVDGLLLGYLFLALRKRTNVYAACGIVGFFSAFLNTLFFMTLLVLFFGRTAYLQDMIGGRNILVFVCTFVGINAVAEMLSSALITAAVGTALGRARLVTLSRE